MVSANMVCMFPKNASNEMPDINSIVIEFNVMNITITTIMMVKSTIDQHYTLHTHAHAHISVYFTAHTLNSLLTFPKFILLQWNLSVAVTVLGSHLSETASLPGPNEHYIKHCNLPL